MDTITSLLVSAKSGNKDAFGVIYHQYYVRIYNYILRHVWNIEHAQDLTSDVFLSLLLSITKYDFIDENHFKNFLYKIATNKINEFFRTKKTRRTYLDSECEQILKAPAIPEELEQADREMQNSSDYIQIHDQLKTLKPVYQNIIQLRIYEDMSYEDISKITDMSVNTLKSHFSRAIKQLKEKMQPYSNLNHK